MNQNSYEPDIIVYDYFQDFLSTAFGMVNAQYNDQDAQHIMPYIFKYENIEIEIVARLDDVHQKVHSVVFDYTTIIKIKTMNKNILSIEYTHLSYFSGDIHTEENIIENIYLMEYEAYDELFEVIQTDVDFNNGLNNFDFKNLIDTTPSILTSSKSNKINKNDLLLYSQYQIFLQNLLEQYFNH